MEKRRESVDPRLNFPGLDDASLSSTYKSGTVLFREGQEVRGVYLVRTGSVKLSVSSAQGKVIVLRDTDGDGKADQRETFADKLNRPFGLVFYKDWLYGGGLSATNVMDYGDYEKVPYDHSTCPLPGGVILNGNWNEVHPIDPRDPAQVQEFVAHSWYHYEDESKGLHPWDGVTQAKFELGANTKGTRTDIKELDEAVEPRVFDPRGRYKANEIIVHPEHGRGKIENVNRNSLLVRFREGLRPIDLK